MNKNTKNFLIDIGIFLAFLFVSEPKLSGMEIHEWLGVALAATIIVHLLMHWDWIVSVGANYFKKMWHASRLKFVVDLLLFVSFVAVITSGLMISRTILPSLGVQLQQNMAWKIIHKLTADTSVLFLGFHFALNWNWILCMLKLYVGSPLARLVRSARRRQTTSVLVSNED